MERTINTDAMTTAELDAIICELRRIRTRKQKAESLLATIECLMEDAWEADMTFVLAGSGIELRPDKIAIIDNQKRFE